MKYEVIFENEEFIAVSKSAGLLSIPDREGTEISLKQMLEVRLGKIFTVHRLDRGTSGLIIFAKDENTHKQLSQLFEERKIEKYYLGLVYGKLTNKKGIIDEPLMEHPAKKGKMTVHKKGKPSLTEYELMEDFILYSWVKFRIHSGRTHQIRVHIQHIGHLIICDDLYGDGKPFFLSSLKRNYKLSKYEEAERPILSRLALHSSELKFDLNGKYYELEAPLPKDLKAALHQLRKQIHH